MTISFIIRVLAGIYFLWAVLYLIIWGVVLRSKNSHLFGGDIPFGNVLETILTAGLYPLGMALIMYCLDRWMFSGDLGRILIPNGIIETSKLVILTLPILSIYLILSVLSQNSIARATDLFRIYKKKGGQTKKVWIGVSGMVILALFSLPIYLYFSGADRLAAYLLWCNASAFLIVRLVRQPSKWSLGIHSSLFVEDLQLVFFGLLRLGVILLGGWLFISISRLQSTNWASPLLFPALLATGLLILSILAYVFGIGGLLGKGRTWGVFLLNVIPLSITLFVFQKGPISIFSFLLLIFGISFGFLFLCTAPEQGDEVGLNQTFAFDWFYGIVLGAVFLVSGKVDGTSYALVLALLTLMTGMATGFNIRSSISIHDVGSFWDPHRF